MEKQPLHSRTNHYVGIAIMIATLGVIWNVIVPGVGAYIDRVFYYEDVESKFPHHSTKAAASYQAYKQSRDNYTELISHADTQINNILKKGGENAELVNLLALRETYQREAVKLKSPILISPFYGNRSTYYFLVCCTFLSISILLLNPEISGSLNKRKLVLFTLFIYIGLVFTNWLRNFAFYDEGRTIFSYVNYDISPLSFLLQELRAIVMALLISILWQQWMIYYGEVKQQFSRWEGKSSGLADISKRSHLVADMFNRWQLNSVLVVGAFLPWTFFYWQNTVALGDSRYVVAALAMHFYWAMSWVLISAPLIYTFHKWSLLKSEVLALASDNPDDSKNVDRTISFVRETNPLTSLQIVGAGVASVVSFLLPLLDAFI